MAKVRGEGGGNAVVRDGLVRGLVGSLWLHPGRVIQPQPAQQVPEKGAGTGCCACAALQLEHRLIVYEPAGGSRCWAGLRARGVSDEPPPWLAARLR